MPLFSDERRRACVFTGHRIMNGAEMAEASGRILSLLSGWYEKGITDYYAGGARGFDMVAAVTVLNARVSFPECRLHLVIPNRDYYCSWSDADIGVMKRVMDRACSVVYLHDTYVRGCMLERNRYMVDRSSLCVAWLKKKSGGTYYTVSYAKKHGLTLYNLASGDAPGEQISMFGDSV